MRTTARQTRENRTITVDFQNEATYFQLLSDGKAFVDFVMAFILSLGFQLKHKTTCRGGGCVTRHSHYVRVKLGSLTIWRIQCITCKAVFIVLPHFVLRYRQMRPEMARKALVVTHDRQWSSHLAPELHGGSECRSLDPIVWGVSTRSLAAGAVVPR